MAEIKATFLCAGGFYVPVLPVAPDGSTRYANGINYFTAAEVARLDGKSLAAVNEGYAVFLQEVQDGIHGTETAMLADRILRQRFRHLDGQQFDEFKMFCRQRGFSPWGQHVWADAVPDERTPNETKLIFGLTVEGLYARALESGELLRTVGPHYRGPDGEWVDCWNKETPPTSARFGVLRRGFDEPMFRTVDWLQYAPYRMVGSDKIYDEFWMRMPAFMLGKCAESVTLRRAFAERLDGLYSPEEMAQSRNPRRRRPGVQAPVLEASAVAVEDLPETPRQFQLRLVDYGFQDPDRRSQLIEQFRHLYPTLYAQHLEKFYATVLAEVRSSPDRYGAVIPDEEPVGV